MLLIKWDGGEFFHELPDFAEQFIFWGQQHEEGKLPREEKKPLSDGGTQRRRDGEEAII